MNVSINEGIAGIELIPASILRQHTVGCLNQCKYALAHSTVDQARYWLHQAFIAQWGREKVQEMQVRILKG